MMYLHEVFSSIQGEGYDTGIPTTFVRFYGCNLKCKYCDQPQKSSDCQRSSIDRIVREVRSHGLTNVCITGGEPLIQKDIYPLVYELCCLGYRGNIETNGSIPLQDVGYVRSYKYIMDIKCPSSGESEHNHYPNMKILHHTDEVKFVIADRNDYDFMKKVLRDYPTKARILVSPMFDKDNKQTIAQDLVKWMIEDRENRMKLQLQIHKFINVQ